MKNIKNSFVLKSLFAFAFVLMVAVVVTFCEIPAKTDAIPKPQEVSKLTFEKGGNLNPRRASDVEIGGQNATRTLYAIGGNGGGNTLPRNVYDIGGAQSFPRQILETSLNDYPIGGNGGTETRRITDIGGNSVPRNLQEIGGSQTASRSVTGVVCFDRPIGGNANPRS